MYSVIVSIGRSLDGSSQLFAKDWSNFMADTFQVVEDYVSRNGGEIVFFGEGIGVYQGHEEDSYTVIGTIEKNTYDVSLITDLAYLASKYEQDSIALTIDEPLFVAPTFVQDMVNVGIKFGLDETGDAIQATAPVALLDAIKDA